ncbi:MAG: hypothetical protein U0570_04940 [Phycisphaerales bacterium]
MMLVLFASSGQTLGAIRKPSVLVVHGEPIAAWSADIQSKLVSSGQFGLVNLFSGLNGTPPLSTLLAYDAVLLSSDGAFQDPVALGNNLADYVDAGGGVVNMAFSTANVSPPAGRWNPGYLSMAAGAGFVSSSPATLDLASITDQNHPILMGVGSFNGGSSSYRANQNSVVAGATVVARWSNGNVLVSTGPLPGRADVNFLPVSNSIRADLWNTSTDGVKLMVNALSYVCRPKVLLLGADPASFVADVKAKLRATGLLSQIDIFDVTAGTPPLSQLANYDAVLTWSDSDYQNSDALGNALADYTDADGGVVVAVFGNTESTLSRKLRGRWAPGYEIVPAGGGLLLSSATLGTLDYPSHPVLTGVTSLTVGSSAFRPSSTSFRPGGFRLAAWSDGKTLAAASTIFHNRIDLGLFPPSSSVDARFWNVGTSGARLMANALVATVKPYVGVGTTLAASYQNDVVAKLAASRRFSAVGTLNVTSATPSAAELRPYHALLIWADGNWFSDSVTLGTRLADQIDLNNAGVVTSLLSNVSASSNMLFNGRWLSDGFDITPRSALPGFSALGSATLGTVLAPNHPVASFVRKFSGGTSSWRQTANPLLRGQRIMNWSDGKMLVSVHNFKRRADLGYVPVSNAIQADYWNQRTDGTWMTANALTFVATVKPCPGDLNNDGLVDDADFTLFLAPYNELVDPRGDFNGDGNTDDSDFGTFLSSYNALVCP